MGGRNSCPRREEERRWEDERRRQQEEQQRREEEARRKAEEDRRIAEAKRLQKESIARDQFMLGMGLWESAWEAEGSNNASDAQNKFQRASEMFKSAAAIIPSNSQYAKYAKMSQFKIEGNAAYNLALKLHEEANSHLKLGQYVEAAKKYSQAMDLFKNGAKTATVRADIERFTESSQFVAESIDSVKDAVRVMSSVQQSKILQQLRQVVNEKQHKQVVNENSNIDVIFQYLKDSNV